MVTVDDALRTAPSEHFDMVLTNPPFGRKSSHKVINALGEAEREDMSYLREDFWATTSNKQLNFLQHVRSLLTIDGRAADRRAGQRAVRGRRRARPSAAGCWSSATCTRCCGCRPGSSTQGRQGERAVLRPQAAVGEAVDRQAVDLRLPHQPATSPSRPAPWPAPTSTTSSPATTPPTGTSAPRPSGSAPSPTTSSSRATRRRWTSSG